jgi:uracil phosphoribosyltransferase/phosphoserine phosphatase
MLLHDIQRYTEDYNLSSVESKLDEVLASQGPVETILVMDADKTLVAVDASRLYWKQATKSEGPLKALFSGPLGYSYTAFRQAVLLYEETAKGLQFDALCQDMASQVMMHPEMVSLLQLVAKQEHVGVFVVTYGLGQVWKKIIECEGLSETVKVLGGGCVADGFVVILSVKAALVARLQDTYHIYVWAFGDSPMDLEMLCKADETVVVTGEEGTRSKTMDTTLALAIDDGLQARQALLPSGAKPRLGTTVLPLVRLGKPNIESIKSRRRLQVFHATTKNTAKLFMIPTRNAAMAGPALRENHRHVGWYLGTKYLADLLRIEEYQVQHVQGNFTSGHWLVHEQQTKIVALMRGEEPMALGLNNAFPLAMFVHTPCPEDVKPNYIQAQNAIVLVDSMVNNDKTVVEFVRHVRHLHPTIHIVVVAGVVQARSIDGGSLQTLGRCGNLGLITFHRSDNKFTGTGTTDTGDRLYNTQHLA